MYRIGVKALSSQIYLREAGKKLDEARIIVPFPLVTESQSVAADAVAVTNVPHSRVIVPSTLDAKVKSATLVLDYTWADTADGTIQLYDATGATVIAETSSKTGGESSEWEEVSVSTVTLGNTMNLRVNITTAGAAGEAVNVHRAFLLLSLGLS